MSSKTVSGWRGDEKTTTRRRSNCASWVEMLNLHTSRMSPGTMVSSLRLRPSNPFTTWNILQQSATSLTVPRHCVDEKNPTFSLPISSPNIDKFSKFFHLHIPWTICNKAIIEFLTTPKRRRYTTVWNINVRETNDTRHQACWWTKDTWDRDHGELSVRCCTVLDHCPLCQYIGGSG